ncbi:cyclase family protein [Thalassotalea sp. M1531]|uniref:Cyclase family protein n=1 Tax=Thalassotalea algicola TaxID=2716224 RepID=A0A7Y0Q6Q1_9GAMM|nr:cyclase family protein [Thalassotalea algicola]NMP31067.1 cyclase family protein [Thalassotalea algicola]
MLVTIEIADIQYQVNTDFALNCSINLAFNQAQPNHFGSNRATSVPMQADGFIGDTEQGGSCNVNELRINPHCNGTHTETIRHICDKSSELALSVADISISPLMPCVLVSITPSQASDCKEDYSPSLQSKDKVITRSALAKQLDNYSNAQLQVAAIRTLPNTPDKLSAEYNQSNQPPFFTREAILYLNERGVEHLVVDIPSIDRLHDDGLLTCHHLFWQVIEGAHQATTNSLINKTITELAYFDQQIDDGFYFMNLQLPAFVNDAAPSRPVLYSAHAINK